MKPYSIKCPECENTFNVKKELDKWKRDILKTLKFFERVEEMIQSKREVKNNVRNTNIN